VGDDVWGVAWAGGTILWCLSAAGWGHPALQIWFMVHSV